MKYLDKNTARALVLLQIEAEEKALSMVPAIKATVAAFDGKIINKRIETALQKIDGGLHFGKTMFYAWLKIEWFIENRYVLSEPDKNGVCGATYIDEHTLTIAHTYDKDNAVIMDGSPNGRLNAAALCAAIDEQAARFVQSIAAMRETLARVDELAEKRRALVQAVEEYSKGIDPTVANYFDLGLRVER